MAELKTKPTTQSVSQFLDAIQAPQVRSDCQKLVELMGQATGAEPVMWGASIVGFGSYHYKYASGREGDWFLTGFAPRKRDLTLYIMSGFDGYDELLAKLGKHKVGKSCLYIKSLADIHLPALRELVERSVRHLRSSYP